MSRKSEETSFTDLKGDINTILKDIYDKGVRDGMKKQLALSRKEIQEKKKEASVKAQNAKKEAQEKIKKVKGDASKKVQKVRKETQDKIKEVKSTKKTTSKKPVKK